MFYNGLKIVTPCFGDDAVFRCEVQNAYGSDQREFVVVVPGEFKLYLIILLSDFLSKNCQLVHMTCLGMSALAPGC